MALMWIESQLPAWSLPWHGVAVALVVAAAWALLFGRLLKRDALAAASAGAGLLAGWLWLLPLLWASPRQVVERLPALALGIVLLAWAIAALPGMARRQALLGWLLALAAAWWLAGAPLHDADLRRAVPILLLAGVAGAMVPRWLDRPGRAAGAAAALAVGALLAGWRGPAAPLAATLAAAALGAALAPRAWDYAGRGALGIALVALAAVPVLSRGAAADGWAAIAPLLALWFAPRLERRLPQPVAPWVAWAAAALPAWVAAAWAAGHFP